jgi:putative glutamine amidotransferase
MVKPPLILVSASTEQRGVEFGDVSLSLSENYPRALMATGGLPLILPCTTSPELVAEAVRACDGVVLTGGDDVTPGLYSSRLPARLARTVGHNDAPRDLRELLVLHEVFRQRKPLLAICRGHQLLNVALGGTLIVDIPSQIPRAMAHNRSDRKNSVVHEVRLTAGSLLANIVGGRTLGVNSSHHQSVGRVADALQVTGRSEDGVIEALEVRPGGRTRLPYLMSVQFHPERLVARHAGHREIFSSFIRACLQNRS